MKIDELDYSFPESLIALEPVEKTRVMWVNSFPSILPEEPVEINKEQLLNKFEPGDLLVINDTQVLKRRVFIPEGIEILFLEPLDKNLQRWHVLMPARKIKTEVFSVTEKITAKIVERGRPQVIEASGELTDQFFESCAELPLPPYIQKARGTRKPLQKDTEWYQTEWAEKPGSLAAPTASFHLTNKDIESLEERGVHVERITLHVGLGTFLPILSDDLEHHQMHSEWVSVSQKTWRQVQKTKQRGRKVWALGTTVTRSLESCAAEILTPNSEGDYIGGTRLFIHPGFEFKVVDALMTNFHQPKTTLLSLVMAFAGVEEVRSAYRWAVEKQFRLFSYGDLSVWTK